MCACDMQGFVEIYRGRENRHRQKNLAHATEYHFRLKASPSATSAFSWRRALSSRAEGHIRGFSL